MADRLGEEPTRPSLLLRLRDAADDEAWRTFASSYAPLVYGYCRKCGLQDADAADVTQDVLAQVARSIRGFDYQASRGRFRDWLRVVTRNRVLRFRGRSAPEATGGGEVDLLSEQIAGKADAEWCDEFHARVLQVALERIRPRFEPPTWQAFERVWREGRSALETSTELALSIDLVYSAKSRILKCLREEVIMLAEDLPEFVSLDG